MEKVYRRGVLAIVIDAENKFLLVQLLNYKDDAWNFVGGGLDPGETDEGGIKKEIREELGLEESDYEILSKASEPIKYDFPQQLIKEGITYDGQIKEQFLVRFTGDKSKIKLQEEEIKNHKWVEYSELRDHLIFPGQYESAEYTIRELLPDNSLF
jgi:putative (di)nucleoside polyphosphate hydrolase